MEASIRNKKIVRTSLVGILGNIALIAMKAFIGFITGSSSIISDAINNLSDAMSSTVTIIGTKLSAKKPNKKHPYGYGRIEYLTATVVAALIVFAGCSAIYESITSLFRGEKPTYDWVAFLVIGLGIAIKLSLGIFFRIQGKRLDSAALKNSGTDALFDVALSASTLVTALVSHFAQVYLEGYAGILIGLFILRSGVLAMKESLSPILGERIDDKWAREIKADICAHPMVRGAYDLIIHSYGESEKIGSIHIEVADDITAKEIFALEREIQTYMFEKHGIIMTVGIYASNDTEPLAKEIKTKLLCYVHEIPDILQCHGYYLDQERQYVTFDLIVNIASKRSGEDIASEIIGKLEKDYPSLRFHANLDQDISA
ncbi:MAG: cation transporter [Bacilli bacterium]|nr:cation transporter [Bacilli bacterium]